MIKKQAGFTLITWVIIIVVVGIEAVAALRIIPAYIDYATVKSVMDKLAKDPDSRNLTTNQLKRSLYERLNINNIRYIEDDKSALKMTKASDGIIMKVNYEARGPIYANLEYVANFEYSVKVPHP